MSNPIEAKIPGEYDIEYETAASRTMLEKRIPAELNKVKLAIVDIDRSRGGEPWRRALTIDLIDAISLNCSSGLSFAVPHGRTPGDFTKMHFETQKA